MGTLACIAFLYCPHAKIKIGMSITTIRQVGCVKVVPVDKLPRKVHVMGKTLKDDSRKLAFCLFGAESYFCPNAGIFYQKQASHSLYLPTRISLEVNLLT